jgi:ABC-type multidrug transport system fused ATPase/permease subunit
LLAVTSLRSPVGLPRNPGGCRCRPAQVRGGAVRFDNVTFGYSLTRPVLRGVSFDVPGGW